MPLYFQKAATRSTKNASQMLAEGGDTLRNFTLFCASSALALAIAPLNAAFAQTESAAPAAEDEGIVVTGSRIPRRDFTAVSPIVTLGAAQIEQSGQPTIEFGLNALPQMVAGTNSTSIQNRTGRASLDLRGLGESRSLVLLDGRRIQPATAGGAVDITSLPSVIVESVETITGGASAVYGSDAMAGVVNFRLRQSFDGIMAEAQFNATEQGGGGSQEYSLVMGDEFNNEAGRAMLVLSYADRNVLKRRDRDFFAVSTVNTRLKWPILNMSANPPSQAAINTVFAQYGAAAGAVSRTTNIGVNDDLTLFTPAPGSTRQIINFRGEFHHIAAFAVLKAPDIPSVLVEAAFISNPDEERRLRDPRFQNQMADAMLRGIVAYFERNPPLARRREV